MPRKAFGLLRTSVACLSFILIAGTFCHFWATSNTHTVVVWNDLDSHVAFERTNALQQANTSNTRPPQPPTPPQPPRHYPTPPPRLTIIAIWNAGPKNPLYLPNFFASVAANPSVDLLFIKYDKHRLGCDVPFAPHVPNVREVCLSTEEYWDLHADFLCGYWGGCKEDERKVVISKLHERAQGDHVNSFFRPFRPAVFAKWIHPDTKIWGWCDMDTILGNVERNLPWDVIEDFDIIFPTSPHDGHSVLLFTPGHLAFFRNSAKVTTEFMKFPNVMTMDNFFNLPWVGTDTEESEYSHFALTRTSLTFIRFPGMVESRYHLSSTLSGVFAIENPGYWNSTSSALEPAHVSMRAALSKTLDERRTLPRQPTFSPEGKEYTVKLYEGQWEHFLWFPQRYAVHVEVDGAQTWEGSYKRYVYRKEPYGPVYGRIEPLNDMVVFPRPGYTLSDTPSQPMFAYEMLYNHFQGEKYADWWRLPGLPARAITEEEVLFVDRENGAHVWNAAGHLTFSATL
ncbi:hypothetical protein HGRIS_000497 [Hohenbuehelia grisea]|uniref:Uncharacterized protein n=1 Tax=Hohenbuehelia grisea TaxID=104357 RepID=A0ABR3JR78_9AGAR